VTATDDLRLVDHHCHGVIAHQPDGEEFRVLATEADRLSAPEMETLDGPYGLALKKHIFPLFGLGLEASYDEFLTARAAREPRDLNHQLIGATNTSHLVIDTGLHGSTLMSPHEMEDHTGIASYEIVRLERVAEEIAPTCTPATFGSRFAEAIQEASTRAVGFKSIIAYRHSLDVDGVPPTESAVREAFADWQRAAESEGRFRITDPVLMQHILWAAVPLRKPIQFHVGYGDSDVSLYTADPSRLTRFLAATVESGTTFTLLHCYPFIREAAILSQVFPHVYSDVGVVTHFLGPSGATPLRQLLEIAPFNKVLYSSDAYGLPEHYLVSAMNWRAALGSILDEWIGDGWIGTTEAERLAALMTSGNAERIYDLERP
jgi:predicted TIM-barrel fold metal-dependent hydrolase